MKTITVKVKFKITELNKTKSIKIGIEFPEDKFPCFSDLVNEVYATRDPPIKQAIQRRIHYRSRRGTIILIINRGGKPPHKIIKL